MSEQTLEQVDHVDVLIVGAGLSGIGAACHLQRELPGKTFAILEARDAIGGTWDLFRYPGIRSDSDMFTLGYRFRPWTDAKAIADGARSGSYIRETAREYGVDRADPLRPPGRARPSGRATTRAGRSTAERTDTGETVALTCGFLYVCTGYYRYDEGYTPAVRGRRALRGPGRPPAALARGPRLRRQAGRRHRQRRDRGHARARRWRDEAAHVTMLQRSPELHRVAARAGPAGATAAPAAAAASAPTPIVRWKNVLLTHG